MPRLPPKLRHLKSVRPKSTQQQVPSPRPPPPPPFVPIPTKSAEHFLDYDGASEESDVEVSDGEEMDTGVPLAGTNEQFETAFEKLMAHATE